MNKLFRLSACVFLCLFLCILSEDHITTASEVVIEVIEKDTGMGVQDKISVNSTYRYNTEGGYIIIYRDPAKKHVLFNEFEADTSYGKVNLNKCVQNIGGSLLADKEEINRVVYGFYQNDAQFRFDVDAGELKYLYYDSCVGIKVYKNCREKLITWEDTEFSFGPYSSPDDLMENLPLDNDGVNPWKSTVEFWNNKGAGVIEIKKAIEEAIMEEREEHSHDADIDDSFLRDSMVVYYPGKCVYCGTKAGGQVFTENGEWQVIKSDLELNMAREGHYLVEWNTSPNFDGVSYLPGEEICFPTKGCILKLYGKWKPIELEVIFFSSDKVQKKKIMYDNSYGAFPDFSKPGNKFLGFYSDIKKSFVSENSLYKLILDDTLEAKYEPQKYGLFLDFGTPEGSDCKAARLYDASYGSEKDHLYINYGQIIFDALPQESLIKAEGYEFEGWFLENGEKISEDDIWENEEDLYLKGKWKNKEYTLTLHDDGKLTELKVKIGEEIKGLYTAQKEGYIFTGWWLSGRGGIKIKENDKWKFAQNDHAYATFEPIRKNIYFDYCLAWKRKANENVILENFYKEVEFDDYYAFLPEPKRYGYDFLGWSREAVYDEFGGPYVGSEDSIVDFFDTVTSYEDETLYAVWKPKEVEVIFDYKYAQ